MILHLNTFANLQVVFQSHSHISPLFPFIHLSYLSHIPHSIHTPLIPKRITLHHSYPYLIFIFRVSSLTPPSSSSSTSSQQSQPNSQPPSATSSSSSTHLTVPSSLRFYSRSRSPSLKSIKRSSEVEVLNTATATATAAALAIAGVGVGVRPEVSGQGQGRGHRRMLRGVV